MIHSNQSPKAVVPATIAMIKSRLKVDCSHTSALDIIASARGFTDYNTLKGLEQPIVDKTRKTNQDKESLLARASRVAGYLDKYDGVRRKAFTQLIITLEAMNDGATTPDVIDELDAEHSAQEIAGYFLREIKQAEQAGTFHFSVTGGEQPLHSHFGMDKYSVAIEIKFGTMSLDIEYEYCASEYTETEEESIAVNLNWTDIEDHLAIEANAQGDFQIDILNEGFFEFARHYNDHQDIDNPDDVLYQEEMALINSI